MTRSKHWFLKLHNALIAKFERECEQAGKNVPQTSKQLYGYDNFEPASPNLVTAICTHPKAKAYLKTLSKDEISIGGSYKFVNGKYLYNKRQEAKKETVEEIGIKEFYEAIYLYYLNFNNWQEFQNSFEVDANWKQFQCFYYSFKRHEVGTFIVQLGFGGQAIQARVRGFHDDSNTYLQGTAKHEQGLLDIKVSNDKNYEITLIAILKPYKTKNKQVL